MKKNAVLLILPMFVFISTSVLLVIGIWQAWLGVARAGIMEFCEYAGNGYIKQPANSYSNLAFSLVGLYIGWYAYSTTFTVRNKMTTTLAYPLLLSSSLIILGAGSFAMHATNTAAGGFLDLFGMFMLSCFVSTYALARWFKLSTRTFIILFVAGVLVGSYIKLTADNKKFLFVLTGSSLWFTLHLLIATVFELLLHYVRKVNIQASLGWAGLFSLILAFLIWNFSRTRESILCDPHLWLQGHAVWHILNALGACFLYLFYTTEVDPGMTQHPDTL